MTPQELEDKLNEQGGPNKEDIAYMIENKFIATRVPVAWKWVVKKRENTTYITENKLIATHTPTSWKWVVRKEED